VKLADLRRLSIRTQSRIRFRLRNGMEAIVTERGVATVPGLNGPPDFNLERELEDAPEFLLETADGKERAPRRLGREEMAGMAAPRSSSSSQRPEE
jgi:hypothetical protein